MRASEFITEAPLVQYEPIGNFDRAHSFRSAVDRKLVTHPVNVQKIHTFLEKSPFDFRVFVINKPGVGKHQEYGAIGRDTFTELFGEEVANKVYNNYEDAITIVYVGNRGADRVMFTPWIMAHRFGHAIQAGTRYQGNQGYSEAWKNAEKYFFQGINSLLNDHYLQRSIQKITTMSNVDWSKAAIYNALFNMIGTMRSARTKKINRPYEFFYECFAQYLQSGTVAFNPLPTKVDYGRKAWGRSISSLYGKDINDDTNEKLQTFANGLTDYFDEVLRDATGRIYVM